MKLHRLKQLGFAGVAAMVVFVAGCNAKAKGKQYLERGDSYFGKQEWSKARLEYLNAYRANPGDGAVSYRLAECFLNEGELKDAFQFLRRAVELQPTNIVARAKLGSMYVAGGEHLKARVEAEAILNLAPDDLEGCVLLAECSTTPNEIKAATQQFEERLSSSPGNPAFPFALGVIAQKSKDLQTAERMYAKAAELEPKNSRFQLALAEINWTLGNTNVAGPSFKLAADLAPVKSYERLRYAEYLKTQNRDSARELLLESISKEPNFAGALNLLTEIMLAEGKPDQAETYNAKALDYESQNRAALLYRARLKITKREIPGAIAELEKLADRYKRDWEVRYYLSVAHVANKDLDRALAAVGESLALNPKFSDAVLLQSELQIRNGDAKVAVPKLLTLTRETPHSARADFLLAEAYRRTDDLQQAVAVYQGLAKSLPRDPQPYYFLGITYRRLGKVEEAQKAFEKALQTNNEFFPALQELLSLDIAAQRNNDAMERLKPYFEKYGEKPETLLLQSKVFVAQKQFDAATKALLKSIELDPEFYSGHSALVALYVDQGRREEAIAQLGTILKKKENDAGLYFQLGRLQEAGKDFKGARTSYETVLKLKPNASEVLNNLAYILSENYGEVDTAYEYARRARELAPYNPVCADTLGWILWKKGDYARSLPLLQEAVDKLGNIPEAVFHLGMAYYMTGAEAAATQALQSVARNPSDFPGKTRASSALAVLKVVPSAATTDTDRILQTALRENPADFVAQVRTGQIYEHQKAWDKAEKAYETALKINSRSVSVLARLAEINFAQGETQRAFSFAKDAWSISPTACPALAFGRVAYAVGDYKWALMALTEARRANPEDSVTVYQLAQTYYAAGRLQPAKNLLEENVQSRNDLSLPKGLLALVNLHLNPSSPVNSVTPSLFASDPKSAPAMILAGLLAEANQDFKTARSNYEEALKLFPGHVTAQRQLGLLLAERLAEDVQAAQLLATVKIEMSSDPQISKALGKIAYRRADYREASRLLRDAHLKNPKDADLVYYLGMAQYHLKDKQAKQSLQLALALDSGGPFAADARKALQEIN